MLRVKASILLLLIVPIVKLFSAKCMLAESFVRILLNFGTDALLDLTNLFKVAAKYRATYIYIFVVWS